MPTDLRERLRSELSRALVQRDRALVSTLRATLAALDNAEAVAPDGGGPGSLALEASPVGVGAREVARRDLSDDDIARVVRAEIAERRAAARVYEQAGRHEHAQRLGHEADTLAALTGLDG